MIEKETLTAAELNDIVFPKKDTIPQIELEKQTDEPVDLSKDEKVSEPIFNPDNTSPTPV